MKTQATANGQLRAIDSEAMPTATAKSLGLVACDYCGSLWQAAETGARCGHCRGRLHQRKPYSLDRTWAYLIAACILYFPANFMPVMITSSLFDEQQNTILSGIIYFWVSGSWVLATIVFIASFLIPLFKLATMLLLVVMAQRRSLWRMKQRARLYRIVEFIGRWSMLDVFVVALLAGLVQIKGFAQIHAGVGIAAFGAVVVLTMLASLSFDPRLTWDAAPAAKMQGAQDARSQESL
ncbi:MAG TPA: paraquat-inducible protein A [Methylophilaceae bacterium]|nr:paraquat-inducible protein A [Methylophilaceae bacterium]